MSPGTSIPEIDLQILYLGHLPLPRHHHLALFRAYARRVPFTYLELVDRRAAPGGGPAGDAMVTLETFAPGLTRRRQRPSLPGGRFRAVRRWNWWLATRAALVDAARDATGKRVLMLQTPGLLPTFAGLPADLIAYLIVDDYAGLAEPADRERVAREHLQAVRDAGLVWAVSPPLAESARRVRAEVLPASHGVDSAAFEAAARAPLWESLAGVPAPRVGALGKLNDRVDWSVVEAIAAARPAWSLVFIGPIYLAGDATTRAIERLRAYPNVHFLPEVPPEVVPRAIAGLDVGLILYRSGTGTTGIHPLKLYQYLAAGRPVVALPIPVLGTYREEVRLAESAEGFISAIEDALGEPDAGDRAARRREIARGLDWERIAEDRLARIRERLSGRPGHPSG